MSSKDAIGEVVDRMAAFEKNWIEESEKRANQPDATRSNGDVDSLSAGRKEQPFAWAIRWYGRNEMRGDVFISREAAQKSLLCRFDPSAGEVVALYARSEEAPCE